jgi:hypothetical protein
MTLTPTQTKILTAAAARPDRRIDLAQAGLKGGAATKVIQAMMLRGLVEMDPSGEFERATDAGMRAVGVEPGDAKALPRRQAREAEAVDRVVERAEARGRRKAKETTDEPTPPGRPARPGSKLERLIALLHRHEGATIEELMAELEWQRHTIRGALSGNLRKKMGLRVDLIGKGRYRIADA